jgi:hypothetical protein
MKANIFILLLQTFWTGGCDYVFEDAENDPDNSWNAEYDLTFDDLSKTPDTVSKAEENDVHPIRYSNENARVFDELMLYFEPVEVTGTNGTNDILQAWGCVEYIEEEYWSGPKRTCIGGEATEAAEGDVVEFSYGNFVSFVVERHNGACFVVKGALYHTRGEQENPVGSNRYCWNGDLVEWVSEQDESQRVGAMGDVAAKAGAVSGVFTWRLDWESTIVSGTLTPADLDGNTKEDWHQVVIPTTRLESVSELSFYLSAITGNPDLYIHTSMPTLPTDGKKCDPIIITDIDVSPDDACTWDGTGEVYLSIINPLDDHTAEYELYIINE